LLPIVLISDFYFSLQNSIALLTQLKEKKKKSRSSNNVKGNTVTIDSAVGTEKDDKNSKKAKKKKMEEKIDKKRICRGKQRTGREKNYNQVVPQ
jgi:hypothetical protein